MPRRLPALALALCFSTACDSCARAPAPHTVGSARPVPNAERETVTPPPRLSAAPELAPARELTWVYDRTPVGAMQVVVSVPPARKNEKLPVLIAMHGRGEAFKGPERGARGWIDDYWMPKAITRLSSPPLVAADFLGMVETTRLTRLNASLRARPYRGLIVVCPYTPDILAGARPFSAAVPLERFLVDDLLPRVYRETPAVGSAAATGIDGVSLGGRASILVGLARPQAFGVVAAVQAAFDAGDATELASRAKKARAGNSKLVLRLLTSDRDFFVGANRTIAAAWEGAGVDNRLDVVRGDHSYEFNRGPGVYEMLLFHDRRLRGEPYL